MEDVLVKIQKLSLLHDKLKPEIIKKKKIKLGLRNSDGTGVIVGITTKGRVVGYNKEVKNGKEKIVHSKGKLYYCGYDVEDLVSGTSINDTFGFDETIYLLLIGELPSKTDLMNFTSALAKRRSLSKPERSVIMEEFNNENQMYALHSVVSHLGRCDSNADSLDIKDVSRQGMNIIAKLPAIIAYNYNVMKFRRGGDLMLIRPKPELSSAENFLYMLKGTIPDKYEAHLFDVALILHAEHGGGNNSTFTVRTVSSSGANTYMAIAAGIASLSGYLHGGANKNVVEMMKKIKKNIKDWNSEVQISKFVNKILDGKVPGMQPTIFGLGHAVYTLSDPRAEILKEYAREFSKRKGATAEYQLYHNVERVASKILSERKNKPINANVDFYSGFLYKLMGIPMELYTPIFAMARTAGWVAHRIEQIIQGKIIRPAYLSTDVSIKDYIKLEGNRRGK